MIDLLIEKLSDTRFLAMVFAAVGAIATVLTLAMPLLAPDTLNKRMKSVALEREKIRQRERERLARGADKVTLRRTPKQYMQTIVDQFNLNKWVGQEEARALLVQAGYRGQAPYVTYLFFRMVMPVAMLMVSLFYLFVVLDIGQPPMVRIGCASPPPISACTSEPVREEQDRAPPAFDQARVSRRARPAADLRQNPACRSKPASARWPRPSARSRFRSPRS